MDLKPKLGFTLIELVVVLVIIVIIAIVAVPRFINLNSSANQAAVNSVAVSLAAAAAENYANRSASNGQQGNSITNCQNVGAFLPNGLPTGYTITGLNIQPSVQATCTVTGPNGNPATFLATGIQ